MESKIMNIFYGADNLPYKDQQRTVHFPVVGQAFMGASNTTEIRFYTDKIGSIDATYISIAKLPNGKVGTKILTKGYDAQIDENYVSLKLSNFYTQAKGDLYISLNGYEGGVELIYNKDTQLYEVYGTPTIQATGSVKIAINYATQYVGDGTEETITLQEIYALFGNKLDKDSPYYIKAIDDISDINKPILAPYLKGNQIVYSKSDNLFYRIVENNGTLSATKLPSAVDCLKLDGSTPMQGNLDMGQHSISNANTIQSESTETTGLLVDFITPKSMVEIGVAKDINMQGNTIKNVAEPTLAQDVATKNYVDEHSSSGEVIDVKINGNSILDSNKVANIELKNSLDNSTNNDIASALATKNAIDSVREVAEGKSRTFILDMAYGISNLKTLLSSNFGTKCYDYQNNDITQRVIDGEFDNVVIGHNDFNTNENSVNIEGEEKYYILNTNVNYAPLSKFYLCSNNQIRALMKLGDIILITQTEVPDRWFGGSAPNITFYKLETSKIDESNLYKKNEDLIPSANNLNIGSVEHTYSTLFADQVYDIRNGQKVFVEDIIHKKVIVKLTYDGSHILDEEGHILGFAGIKQLLDNVENYVYINDLTKKLILNFGAYEVDTLCFNGIYKIDGKNHLVRLIINSQDQIQYDEDIVVNADFVTADNVNKILTVDGKLKVGNNIIRSNSLDLLIKEIYNFTDSNFKGSERDLGHPQNQWKDLYLSGKAYIGGSGFNIDETGGLLSVNYTSGSTKTQIATYSSVNGVGIGSYRINGATKFTVKDNDNNTIFEIDGANCGVLTHIFPKIDNTYSLGNSTSQWKDIYLSGDINLSNDRPHNIKFGDIEYAQINTNIIYVNRRLSTGIVEPQASHHSAYTVGSSNRIWDTVYTDNISDGTNSVSVAQISNATKLYKHTILINGNTYPLKLVSASNTPVVMGPDNTTRFTTLFEVFENSISGIFQNIASNYKTIFVETISAAAIKLVNLDGTIYCEFNPEVEPTSITDTVEEL